MQLNEPPINRRDAKGAEADQSHAPGDLSLKGDGLERSRLALFSASFASLRFICTRPDRIDTASGCGSGGAVLGRNPARRHCQGGPESPQRQNPGLAAVAGTGMIWTL